MKYALLVYETAEDFADRSGAPERYWAAYTAFGEALKEAGVAAGGTALQTPDPNSTTLRLRDGGRIVQDGPFADTKEQLGGLFIIEVPDLDAALYWAARCPAAATGSVEVRPLLEM